MSLTDVPICIGNVIEADKVGVNQVIRIIFVYIGCWVHAKPPLYQSCYIPSDPILTESNLWVHW